MTSSSPSSSTSSSKQRAAACIMQAVGNGRTRRLSHECPVRSRPCCIGVNLMRPAQKERETANEWPNERCAAGLRDFPEEISRLRRRRYRYGTRSILRAYTRLLAFLNRQTRAVKRLKYCDNVTRTYTCLSTRKFSQ